MLRHVPPHAFKGPDVGRFLKHLLRHVPGKLVVIWDGAPIQRCQAVKVFLAAGPAARLQLDPLPRDAPDVNPDEGIGRSLKRGELRTRCFHDLPEFQAEFTRGVARLRHKRHILKVGLRHAGYQLEKPVLRSIRDRCDMVVSAWEASGSAKDCSADGCSGLLGGETE